MALVSNDRNALLAGEAAEWIERSEIQYMKDRMEAIQGREGNPEGVEIAEFGEATAFYSRTMPWGLFNNVKGPIAPERLDEIIGFYDERERQAEFQLLPSRNNGELMQLLAERGYYQSGFHTSMFKNIGAEEEEPDGSAHDTEVRELKEEEFGLYAEIHCLGTGMSIEGKVYVEANNKVLFDRPGWKYYIGLCEGTPAAVGVMYMEDGIASFTFAATLPEFRGRGLQSALLRRRLSDASKADCRLAVSQCSYGSTSHRNMERAGMSIGYVRASWNKRR